MWLTHPVASVLGNVFTNLLGRQTQGTDLGSQSGLGSDLTTSHTQVARQGVSFTILFGRTEEFCTYMIFTSLGSSLGADG